MRLMAGSWSTAALGLLLAACAQSAPEAVPTDAVSPPAVASTAAPGGTWIVTDAFPAGAVIDAASTPRGQRLQMDADNAGDAAGRLCPAPFYRTATAPLGRMLVVGVDAVLDREVPVLEIDCVGRPFARYAALPDGSLLTRHGPWLLRLERGKALAANPAPMMPDSPVPAANAASAVTHDTPPSPTLVYLASYRTEAGAAKGWSILAAASASLKALHPVTRGVDIHGKGRYVRLFAPAGDAAAAKRICSELGKAIAECGTAGREH